MPRRFNLVAFTMQCLILGDRWRLLKVEAGGGALLRITKLRMQNFRSFKDCAVDLDTYTSLVGPNGAGKSTVLAALNVFFRETESAATDVSDLDAQDFHNRDVTKPIVITVTFGDLSEVEQETFKEYYRHGSLIVSAEAVFDESVRKGHVRQFGQRLGMEAFKPFFGKLNAGAPASEINTEYEKLQSAFSDLPRATSKDAKRDALYAYEASHQDACVLIPSEDQFYGFSKGANRLAQHVQWVYLPAVKDATTEGAEGKNTALGKILARTVRARVKFDDQIDELRQKALTDYRQILSEQQSALNDVSKSLTQRLGQWAHPNATARLEWTEELNKSVQVSQPIARLLAGEGLFEGELARFGHGLQRSYLLALLQELAGADDSSAPRLILGCEEPELYQHPPQARHLASVLQSLSEANSQILLTTHSPYFVSGVHFDKVRMIRQDRGNRCSNVAHADFDAVAKRLSAATGKQIDPPAAQSAKLQQALQPHLNELFFANKVVLVEGLEDIAYITTYFHIIGGADEFRRHGCHFICCNGKNYMPNALAIASELSIPIFTIFDSDGDVNHDKFRPMHEADNKAILHLVGGEVSEPFPKSAVWADTFVQWPTNFGDVLQAEVDKTVWDKTYGEATNALGRPQGKYGKNPVHIGIHLEGLMSRGTNIPSLQKVGEHLLSFASQ